MYRPCLFRCCVLLATVSLSSTQGCTASPSDRPAQTLQLVSLSTSPVRIASEFTYPTEVLEFADSSIIVGDRREAQVLRLWPTGKRQSVGRLGDGPGEFRRVWAVLRIGPDSIVVSPTSTSAALAIVSIQSGKGRSVQRRDVVEMLDSRRDPLVESHSYTRADGTDHVYGASSGNVFRPRQGTTYTDSVPIVRLNVRSGRIDTVIRFAIGEPPSVLPPLSGDELRQQLDLGPYRAQNDWVVKGDGTIIVVDSKTYKVSERSADGRTLSWPDLPPLPIREISDSEWSTYLDSTRAQQQRLLAPLGVMFSKGRNSPGVKVTLLDPPRPRNRPPVSVSPPRRRVMLSPSDLWVPLGDCKGDSRECWDVLSLATRSRQGTIRLNAGETLLGLSRHFVYVGREDEDGLISIWRHGYPRTFPVK